MFFQQGLEFFGKLPLLVVLLGLDECTPVAPRPTCSRKMLLYSLPANRSSACGMFSWIHRLELAFMLAISDKETVAGNDANTCIMGFNPARGQEVRLLVFQNSTKIAMKAVSPRFADRRLAAAVPQTKCTRLEM